MRDENQNKGNDNPNFDELIKELNLLLDKIPEIIENNKINNETNQPSSQLDIENNQTAQEFSQEYSDKENKKTSDLNNTSVRNEDVIIKEENILSDDLENLTIDDKNEQPEQQDIYRENINLNLQDANEILEKDEFNKLEKGVETDLSLDEPKIEKEENVVEIDLDNNLDLSNFKLEENTQINVEMTSYVSNNLNEVEIKAETNKISFEQPVDAITETKGFNYFTISNELEKVINRNKPDNILDERVRRIAIIYASNDEKRLKDFINFLDEISLSSKEKPMFVERPIFVVYDENFSSEAFIVNAQNEKINGVVLIGDLPVDKVYELESSISQLGCIFLNLKGEINKSVVIDFILDLIAV